MHVDRASTALPSAPTVSTTGSLAAAHGGGAPAETEHATVGAVLGTFLGLLPSGECQHVQTHLPADLRALTAPSTMASIARLGSPAPRTVHGHRLSHDRPRTTPGDHRVGHRGDARARPRRNPRRRRSAAPRVAAPLEDGCALVGLLRRTTNPRRHPRRVPYGGKP